MVRQKKDFKSILLILVIICLVVFSNLPMSKDLRQGSNKKEDNFITFNDNKENNPLLSSKLNLTDPITGNGVNQSIRVYMDNKSISTNNQRYFDINAPANIMNLSSGEFNFNFGNNFTTEYIIEDDNALYPDEEYFDEYDFNSGTSNLSIYEGIEDPREGFDQLVDDDSQTYWNISSSANGLVNFTIIANFSGVVGKTIPIERPVPINFNRKNIIGLILNFTYGLDKDANVTVKIKDFFYTGEFKTIVNKLNINSTLSPHDIDELFINENLNFINESDCVLIQFIFNRTGDKNFNVSLYEFDLRPFMVLELLITEQNDLALEFDLRGANSTINGIYVWIRTLNLTKAQNQLLNITLYKANATLDRDDLFDNNLINPDLTGGLLYSKEYTGYNADKLNYFKIEKSNLDRFNYFIVIKTNSTDVYSLVTLPQGDYGDGIDDFDHQLKNSTDGGISWSIALHQYALNYELDASQFKLNVTRGFMPSDFNNSLKIQDKDITNDKITIPNEPTLEWGLGHWNNSFTNPIGNPLGYFRIVLSWDENIIQGFEFDVNYTVDAFRNENATSYYKAIYNQYPQWVFNYSLDLNSSKFNNWNFTELWFIYKDYFDAKNLTTPDYKDVYSDIGEEVDFSEQPNFKKVVIDTVIVNISDKTKYTGIYSLNLTSPNAIIDSGMRSFINYNGILWETNGFMYGDNISVSVDIQDHNGLAPSNTNSYANVTLFYPNGTKFLGAELYNNSGKISKDGSYLSYDFNNDTILNLNLNIPLASEIQGSDYSLGFFWTNGSEIGCKKIPIYIDAYNINITGLIYDRGIGKNTVSGTTLNNVLDDDKFTLLIASINETTGIYRPNFYPVKNLSISREFSYESSGIQVPVLMKSFLQNETILNPEEEINVKVSIQNIFTEPPSALNVKISAKLVSLANNDWIIAENFSDTKRLEHFGDPNDSKEFNVNLTIPKLEDDLTWKGINSPIRQGGAKTVISVYIENNFVGTYESNEYSLIINTTDDIFEGYILGIKYPSAGRWVGQHFERSECIYMPNKTSILINIYDENYVSSYNQFVKNFNLSLDSEFTNINLPNNIKEGEIFNISSTLSTELGESLPFKSVTLQYDKNDNWINITSPKLTNINGSTSFNIDTKVITLKESMIFRLIWFGDGTILNNSKILNIPISIANDRISLSSQEDDSFVYNNKKSTITISIKNTGNSILKIVEDDISVDIDEDVDYEIISFDDTILNRFIPGESTTILIEIDVPDDDFKDFEIIVTITAVNIFSSKSTTQRKTINLDVASLTLYDYFIEYFIVIILAFFALVCVITYFYTKKLKKRIELPAKEIAEKRPRRGRYVKVSELKAKEEEKVVEITKESEGVEPPEPSVEEIEKEPTVIKKTVDFDALLEEEITEKKVEPKKIKKEKKPKKERKPKKAEKKKEEPKKERKPKKAEKKKAEPKKVKKGKKEPKKVEKKIIEPKKVEKKKTTDLDTLLEEEGLKKEKKIVEKKKKSGPKPLSTRQMVAQKKRKKKKRKR